MVYSIVFKEAGSKKMLVTTMFMEDGLKLHQVKRIAEKTLNDNSHVPIKVIKVK